MTGRRDQGVQDPFLALHQQIDRAFDEILKGTGLPMGMGGMGDLDGQMDRAAMGTAAIDIRETDQNFEVCAELPGFREEDIDVSVHADRLTIAAETVQESKERRRDYLYSERRQGSVRRTIQLPAAIDDEGASATYENGVLTVRLRKAEPRAAAHRIPIGKAAGRGGEARGPQLQQAAQTPAFGGRDQQRS